MHLKREFKREAFASRIFKTLRNYTLPVIFGFFLLALTANTASAEPTTTQQQTVRISGKIVDSSGEPLIGASVVEKGTTNGTATDTNGAYTLSVNPNATIEVKYIGFLSQSFKAVSGRNVYDIAMKEDSKSLDEVVVIGYGVQKKKLVTGATISVSGEDIEKLSTTNPFAALQSKTPGVSIYQGSGQPGEDYIINIRGIGTNGNSKPLYVVDGVASGDNALNSMSPADIESIDILKDAASAAIYGSRAANGVVLITTKQGKVGKPHITYTGSYGQQYMAKKPDMLDAKQYILVQDEISFNEGTPPYEWANLLPAGKYDDIMSGKWKGTDWVDAFYNKGAQVQNHSLNLTGGNEYSKFSIGYSYMKKDGIFGEAVQPHWNRSTFRINSEHVILKVKDFNAITIGENLNYNYRTKQGISIGGMYWNAFHNILTANPLMPVYNDDGTYYDYDSKVRDGWNFDGNFGNPIASVAHNSQGLNLSKNHNLNASVNIQIQPIKGLIFKSQYAYQMSASSYRSDDQKIHLSNITNTTTETVNQDQSVGYYWKLDNTLTYNFSVNAHHVEAQIGQSAEKGAYGEAVRAMGKNNIFDLGWDYAWVSNTRPTQLNEVSAGGYPIGQNPSDDNPWGPTALASFWGRAHYNYNETYLATLILRADGSSNFARGHRWGYFPSVSAGWVLTNEPFLETAKGTLDFLKLRASWGQNGNSNITPFQYLNQYKLSATALYYFGTDKITQSSGAKPGVLRNPDVTWETSEQTDLGFDSRFLSNRLGVIFDYYVKTTKNWLLITPISAAYGFDPPYGNGGDMRNSGVELALSWDDHIGDFRYGINLNGRYNQGKVTKINNSEKIIHGDGDVLSQGTSEFYRLQVGLPYGFFYGYKADGIFQNWDEVNAYTYTYVDEDTGKTVTKPIIPGTKPGDVRFRDVNGDGKIDEKDKMPIGNCQPKVIAGFGLNLAYKGFDFIASAHGEFGMQIAKSYRSVADSRLQNFTTDIFGRWTGEGTSNKIPRLTSGNSINYQNVSDIYIENADYVKIQNLTLGYDFKRLMPKLPLGQARLYVTAENAFTITGYSGQDPEVGFGNGKNYMRGIDLGFYPSAKTYLVGVNLTF